MIGRSVIPDYQFRFYNNMSDVHIQLSGSAYDPGQYKYYGRQCLEYSGAIINVSVPTHQLCREMCSNITTNLYHHIGIETIHQRIFQYSIIKKY